MRPDKPRVLMIAPQPYFDWRGSPIRVGFNVQALVDLGYAVDLLTMPLGEDRQIPGARIIRIRNVFRLKSLPIGPSFWKALYDIGLLFGGLRLSRNGVYRVVHAIEDAGIIGVLVARLRGAKLIFEKHSDPSSYRTGFFRNLFMAFYARVEAFVIRRADAVIGTGPGLVEQARRIAPAARAYHIFDIPSSLIEADPERVRAIRASLQANPDERLITYVGSFAVYQGIELLFEALPRVARENERARFVIIGGTADEMAQRRRQMAQQGVVNAVSFLGKIPPDDLPHYLAASDILLSPRVAGTNTPLKLLDYLKAGRAIVATDNEANRLILDASNAVLVQPDAGHFAEGVSQLLRDDERREQLGARSRQLVRERYHFDEFKKRLMDCYNGVLDGAAET